VDAAAFPSFFSESPSCAHTATKLGMVRGVFLEGQRRPLSQGAVLQHPLQMFWDLLHTPTARQPATKFCTVIELDEQKIFTGSISPTHTPSSG